METAPQIILTNDDGIHSAGLRDLYETLAEIGDVVAVAPSINNSGMGRVLSMGRSVPIDPGDESNAFDVDSSDLSFSVPFQEHELGYEVEGTPADCVIAAVLALDVEPDIIVSGCNPGPNTGVSVLGRSGTVSAAMEAAHLDVPGIAVSSTSFESGRQSFEVEAAFTSNLLEFCLREDVFDSVDFLNTIVPPTRPEGVALTRPSTEYNIEASTAASGDAFEFTPRHLNRLRNGEGPEWSTGTDRHAIHEGHASISPLSLHGSVVESEALGRFADEYPAARP